MGTVEEYSKGGEVMNYTPKQLAKADSLVGQKYKIYYPWKQRYIHRVVRKDWNGFYVKYEGQRRKLRLAINDFGDFLGFEMLHGEMKSNE